MQPQRYRVRFAPSPTGYFHIGSARTALFNWLFARHSGGTFLLRIEDTDKERSTQEYFDSILHSLQWLGLAWNGEPYIQSQHSDKHLESVHNLLKNDSAYKCFCTFAMLEKKRKDAQYTKIPYRYDKRCRDLSPEEVQNQEASGNPFTVRCRVPDGETVFDDVIHGRTVFHNSEIDDFVILRTNNTPTYQLAVVVDDHEMGITHVIRGDDHLSNTPKQIVLYKALDWNLPAFAHMPMILGPDKARLSKRHGAVSVEVYRERGYLPEAVRNFLILLGWSPGDDREIIGIDEVIKKFTLAETAKKPAVFDEQKLVWMNGQYITALPEPELGGRLKPFIAGDEDLARLVYEKGEAYLLDVVTMVKPRMKLLTDFISFGGYFYRDPVVYDPAAVKKYWREFEVMERLGRLRLSMIDCEDYSMEGIETAVRALAERLDISAAKIIHPTRLALTGFGISPGLFDVMHLLGKDNIICRLETAIRYLNRL